MCARPRDFYKVTGVDFRTIYNHTIGDKCVGGVRICAETWNRKYRVNILTPDLVELHSYKTMSDRIPDYRLGYLRVPNLGTRNLAKMRRTTKTH